MSLSTDGLIIKVNNVGEYDRVVSVLTRELGVIRAFVHGARAIKSKNNTGTALLTYSHLTLQSKKDTYTITEADTNEAFINIRSDIEKLALAQFFCELALNYAPVEADASEYLRLILNSLHFLSNGKREPRLLKSITELRILALSGYTPDLVACRKCAKYEDSIMYFDPDNASIYCSSCRPLGQFTVSIGMGALSAMRHIVFSDFNSLYNFSVPDAAIEQLGNATEKFLLSQAEHKFVTLEFYKNL